MPDTLKQVVDRVKAAKTAIGSAITAKGGTVGANDGLEEFAADIATIPSGGSSSGNDVIFYDYDGSVVASYSATDFANLSAMPANPTHEGLTAQGWNWSLSDAKAYVAANGKLNIGQMYITSDGKTRFYFVIPKYNLTLNLYLYLDSDTELDVDWGDNSEHTTWTSNDGAEYKEHEYSDGGRYVVAITVLRGGFYSYSPDGYYLGILKRAEYGNGVTSIESKTFYDCSALSSVTIPNSVESIGENAFYQCKALSSITIPNGVTSIGENAFAYCYALSSVTIPNSVESISGSAFYDCYALSSITISSSVTSIGENVFEQCGLTSITIPNGVTSIGSQAFYYCSALSSITIPNSVTSIGGYAFYDCYALSSITFESTTPPDLYGELGIDKTCTIRVPQGSLSAYTSAENYPDPSEYIYEEY